MRSEGEARALAREKLGPEPIQVAPGKLRSATGKWQYRAKPADVEKGHIHLEELNPETGEVKQNLPSLARGTKTMNQEIQLAKDATLTTDSSGIVCDLANSDPAFLALGFELLREGLVDKVILRSSRGNWVVRVSASESPRHIALRWYAKGRLDVVLGQIELGRWLVYFLKFYRDGVAEVDHLDLEAELDGGEVCDFTLKVATAEEPVSGREARRRLGL
jgi:hypothetical protein